jgi:hypothetical protein
MGGGRWRPRRSGWRGSRAAAWPCCASTRPAGSTWTPPFTTSCPGCPCRPPSGRSACATCWPTPAGSSRGWKAPPRRPWRPWPSARRRRGGRPADEPTTPTSATPCLGWCWSGSPAAPTPRPCTAADLGRFLRAVVAADPPLLEPELRRAMLTPALPLPDGPGHGYGLGVEVDTEAGYRRVGHQGRLPRPRESFPASWRHWSGPTPPGTRGPRSCGSAPTPPAPAWPWSGPPATRSP